MSSRETKHLNMEKGFWRKGVVEEGVNLQAPDVPWESKQQAAMRVCQQCPVQAECKPKMALAKMFGIFPADFLAVQGKRAGTDECLLKKQGIDVC